MRAQWYAILQCGGEPGIPVSSQLRIIDCEFGTTVDGNLVCKSKFTACCIVGLKNV
jgi:hypothetical protein